MFAPPPPTPVDRTLHAPLNLGNVTSRLITLQKLVSKKEDLPLHGQTETADFLGHVLLFSSRKQIGLIPYLQSRKIKR